MFNSWNFLPLFERVSAISKGEDSSNSAWIVIKIGGFRVECSKESLQAFGPVLPIIMRLVGKSLPYLACLIVGGVWTNLSDEQLPTPPTEADVPAIENICPFPQEEQP